MPVGVAASDDAGFIAAVSLDGEPQLLAGVDGKVSAKIDDQLAVCSRKEFSQATADPEEISAALETIQRWITSQRAAMTAGVSESTWPGKRSTR